MSEADEALVVPGTSKLVGPAVELLLIGVENIGVEIDDELSVHDKVVVGLLQLLVE